MRAGLTITNREVKRVERSLNALEKRYAKGRIPQEHYIQQKGRLLSELNRPRAEKSNLARNPKAWWKRNEVNLSPAPVGYWNHHSPNAVAHQRPLVNQNKIRAALISNCGDGYWNSNDFQQAIRISANNSNAVQQNEAIEQSNRSFFEETVMASKNLGKTEANNLWNEISNSPQVVRALENLSKTIDKTVKNLMKNGISESNAVQAVRNQAVTSGRAITTAGYNPEDAAQLIKAVACGQMTMQQAMNNVVQDINNTSHAVANTPAAPMANNYDLYNMSPRGRPRRGANAVAKVWQNNYDPYNMTPTGVSLEVLMQTKNQLQQQFDLENNPAKRNEISFALNNLQQELNRRQAGIDETPSFETMTTIDVPSQGRGYNPTTNYRAPNSTMQQTVRAMANGPSIATVVKDIFTVQSNVYFDWMTGPGIEFLNNGTYKNANNKSNPVAVFPKGDWTIFAQSKSSLPTMRQIAQSLEYAISSPLWAPSDKAYLQYLKSLTSQKINELEALANEVDPIVNLVNNSNNNAVNNAINNSSNQNEFMNMLANYKQKLEEMTTEEVYQHAFDRIEHYIRRVVETYSPEEVEMMIIQLLREPGSLDVVQILSQLVSEQEFAMDMALLLHLKQWTPPTTMDLLLSALEFAETRNLGFAQNHIRYLIDIGLIGAILDNMPQPPQGPTQEEYYVMIKIITALSNGYFNIEEHGNNQNYLNPNNANNNTLPNNLVPNNNNVQPNNNRNNNGLPVPPNYNNNNNVAPPNVPPAPPGAPPIHMVMRISDASMGSFPVGVSTVGGYADPSNYETLSYGGLDGKNWKGWDAKWIEVWANGKHVANMVSIPSMNKIEVKKIPEKTFLYSFPYSGTQTRRGHPTPLEWVKIFEQEKLNIYNALVAAQTPSATQQSQQSQQAPITRPAPPSIINNGGGGFPSGGGGGVSPGGGFLMGTRRLRGSTSTTTSTSSNHMAVANAGSINTGNATNQLSQSFLRGSLGLSTSTSSSTSSSHPRHLPNDPRAAYRNY